MAVAVDMHPNTKVIIKIATRPIQKVDQSSGFRKSRRLLQKPDGLDSYMVYMVSIRSLQCTNADIDGRSELVYEKGYSADLDRSGWYSLRYALDSSCS